MNKKMKKIIWISSYPKSGNTWMRYLLGNYFFNKQQNTDLNISKLIPQFPPKKILEKYSTPNELKKNPYLISKYWIKMQEDIKVLNDDLIFLKNHNALLSINGNEFTNEDLSYASIYVVRDPRDVVISYSHFMNKSFDAILDKMCADKLHRTYSNNDFSKIAFLGSWKFHYISWRDGIPNMPKIIVKYEDLLKDTKKHFLKVLNFLSKERSIEINKDLVKYAVDESSFKKLQTKEIENVFTEHFSKSNSLFFREGRSSQWKNLLNIDQIRRIEDNFKKEMIELNYL